MHIAQMLRVGWNWGYLGTFNEGEGKWLVSQYFLDNDRLGKTNKVAKYQPAKWGIEDT